MLKSSLLAGLLGLAAITPAHAEDLVFMLDNRTSFTIAEFYASPTNVTSWEEDILGPDVLPAGSALRITIADGRAQCEYDLRFVFDDGEYYEDVADLCETGSYTLNE